MLGRDHFASLRQANRVCVFQPVVGTGVRDRLRPKCESRLTESGPFGALKLELVDEVRVEDETLALRKLFAWACATTCTKEKKNA